MAMARSVAKLLSAEPAPRQRPARRVRDRRPASAAWPRPPLRARSFAREGVGVSLTVTPCWCYGSETMDMDPLMPKAVWGFNGTERPGAVYLAAVLAAHNQKGLPAFSIYGRDVQDARRHDDPGRRARRSCCASPAPGWRWPRCAASPTSRWAASRWASPARSSTTTSSRTTSACASRPIDMTEFVRRIEEEIYDQDEFERALAWVKANCREGKDYNAPGQRAQPRAEGRGLGDVGQDGADRARPDGRQPAPGRAGLRRGGAGPQRHLRRASRGSASGPTTSPTATSWRRSSTRPSTGTASASPSSWPPRTTA